MGIGLLVVLGEFVWGFVGGWCVDSGFWIVSGWCGSGVAVLWFFYGAWVGGFWLSG